MNGNGSARRRDQIWQAGLVTSFRQGRAIAFKSLQKTLVGLSTVNVTISSDCNQTFRKKDVPLTREGSDCESLGNSAVAVKIDLVWMWGMDEKVGHCEG
jgi:hypothetical protein